MQYSERLYTTNLATWLLLFLAWLLSLNRGTIRADLMAGSTGTIAVLPQPGGGFAAIAAIAAIAGMPSEYGLQAGMIPTIIAVLFGSSLDPVSGPTTGVSIVLFSTLGAYSELASLDFAAPAQKAQKRMGGGGRLYLIRMKGSTGEPI